MLVGQLDHVTRSAKHADDRGRTHEQLVQATSLALDGGSRGVDELDQAEGIAMCEFHAAAIGGGQGLGSCQQIVEWAHQ